MMMRYWDKVEYLCLLLQIKGIDFFELTFLVAVNTGLVAPTDPDIPTSWKKKVALLACKAAWESAGPAG
jgi:hypothetical protein